MYVQVYPNSCSGKLKHVNMYIYSKLHLISVASCDTMYLRLCLSLLIGAALESDVQGPDQGRQTVRHPQGGLEAGQPPKAAREGRGTLPLGKYL